MVPKKSKELIKQTAQRLGKDESMVSDLISFYWAEIRKSLVEMRCHNIYVENFGTFKAKGWRLDEVRLKYESQLAAKPEPMTFRAHTIRKDIETKLEGVKSLQKMIAQDHLKKQQVKEKRYGPIKDLDQQEEDHGGDLE